jgi:hypothetical protein
LRRSLSFAVRGACLGLCLCLAACGTASAHEFWLAPSHYRAGAGDSLAIHAFVGTGFRGEGLPFSTRRAVRLILQGAGSLDLAPLAVNGSFTFAELRFSDPAGLLVAYESAWSPITLEPDAFDAYLKLEGLDEPLAKRALLGGAAPEGRERYARCAKTWIAGTDPERALRPVGLALEIVPLADPVASEDPGFRVLYETKPLAGALVRAWRQPLEADVRPLAAAARDSVGPVCEARTGKDGTVRLRLIGSGEWLVSTVHMVASADPVAADWESRWASFTFGRPEREPR